MGYDWEDFNNEEPRLCGDPSNSKALCLTKADCVKEIYTFVYKTIAMNTLLYFSLYVFVFDFFFECSKYIIYNE